MGCGLVFYLVVYKVVLRGKLKVVKCESLFIGKGNNGMIECSMSINKVVVSCVISFISF